MLLELLLLIKAEANSDLQREETKHNKQWSKSEWRVGTVFPPRFVTSFTPTGLRASVNTSVAAMKVFLSHYSPISTFPPCEDVAPLINPGISLVP